VAEPAPIRIAFVKFGGLSAGGTERWLQMMAANLSVERFAVDYLYCDAAPYIGGDFKHPDTDPDRLAYMEAAGVNLVKFHVGAKDITTPTHEWVDTDFWDVFDRSAYDFVQTAKAGPAEYPYYKMDLPVVEYVTLTAGVDKSRNLALSIHLSQWQRREWAANGGDLAKSDVIPIPAEPPASSEDLREELGIPAGALVAGFHQRAQDEIFSPIPLDAFARVARHGERWFAIMGGSSKYRDQAASLGLDNVVFVDHSGGAERISRFLNTLDVFAHGRADGETFGTVFAEAMMHGKPCISHRSAIANAQPETIGPAGLFALGVDDYEAKLDALLSDSALRGRLAAKARPHAERYYSLESIVAQLEQVYARVAGRSAGPAHERPIPYRQSDLGFLVAGDLEDERAADVLPFLLKPGMVYEEVESAGSTLALMAAHLGSRVHLDGDSEAMRASVQLNNWEDRVIFREKPVNPDLVVARSALPGRETQRIDGWHLALTPEMVAALPGWKQARRHALRRRIEAMPAAARKRSKLRFEAFLRAVRRRVPF
jgi:hypothetical protein